MHRFGTQSKNFLHPQKPGWVYKDEKKMIRHKYTLNPTKLGYHIPYTNDMNDDTLHHSYVYTINCCDLLYSGFELTDKHIVPTKILDLIAENEWINDDVSFG